VPCPLEYIVGMVGAHAVRPCWTTS